MLTYHKEALPHVHCAAVRTHQFLCLGAEEGIDTDDEGGGSAQDL